MNVPGEITAGEHLNKANTLKFFTDPSSIKGRAARTLLWRKLESLDAKDWGLESEKKEPGEPHLLTWMAKDLQLVPPKGLPQSQQVIQWAERCEAIFKGIFEYPSKLSEEPTLLAFLKNKVRITCSNSFYVPSDNLTTIREIIRQIETQRPFRALIDLALYPRMLAYPRRRRFPWQSKSLVGECFAVANYDPDRWGTSTNKWIPMSESAYAEKDRSRWAKIMVVSPFDDDPEVWHAVDRFRNECRRKGIRVVDVDPDEAHMT